jgi:hypothetical protein
MCAHMLNGEITLGFAIPYHHVLHINVLGAPADAGGVRTALLDDDDEHEEGEHEEEAEQERSNELAAALQGFGKKAGASQVRSCTMHIYIYTC